MKLSFRFPRHLETMHFDGSHLSSANGALPGHWGRWHQVVTAFRQSPPGDTGRQRAWYYTFRDWCVRWLQFGHWSELNQSIYLLLLAYQRAGAPPDERPQALLWEGFGALLRQDWRTADACWRQVAESAPETPLGRLAARWRERLVRVASGGSPLDWYLLYRQHLLDPNL